MKRIALALATVAIVLAPVLSASPAQAGAGPACFGFSVTSAVRNQGGDVKLTGNITCLAGYRFRAQTIVGEPAVQPITNQAKGHIDPVDATGAVQVWHSKLTTTVGSISLGAAKYSIQVHASSIACCDIQAFLYNGSVTIT